MSTRERTRGLLALMLPAFAALAFVVAAPEPACAEFGCGCDYGGPYSHGACIHAACTSPSIQQCNAGQWTGCKPNCDDLDPCEGS
jgi:hypothetical protein